MRTIPILKSSALFSFCLLLPIATPGPSVAFKADDPQPAWRQLFNGRDLKGWKHIGGGRFRVENGMLKTESGMGLLWYTKGKLGDVVIRVVYRNPGGANSGLFIRMPGRPTKPWTTANGGYEVQIDDTADDYHVTGVLYAVTKAAARPARSDEWNTMEVILDGDRTLVHVNGVLVTDYTEGQPVSQGKEKGRPRFGFIGIQNHGKKDTVYFREISVRPLTSQ